MSRDERDQMLSALVKENERLTRYEERERERQRQRSKGWSAREKEREGERERERERDGREGERTLVRENKRLTLYDCVIGEK